MIVKTHTSKEGILLAVCDSDILGKKFEDDKLQLDLTGGFYKGEEKSEDELREMLKTAYIVNLVGKNSVDFAIKEGIVSEDNVIKVQGVPHAQAVLFHN
jgi:hypothetical protein